MKSKKNKIMIFLCIAVVFMATGYAILSSNLNIKGTSSLTDTWGIKITNVESIATGRAYNISDPTYTDTSMTFEVGVKEPGDKMTFNVTVQNFGSLDAILSEIDATASGDEEIIYSITGIQKESKLTAGSTITFQVTTEFDINATSMPYNPVKDLTINLVYVQDDGQTLNPSDPSIIEGESSYPTLVTRILKDNKAFSDTNIDFSLTSKESGTNGLYYTSTNTEDNGTTYYFRGNVENNYVSFATGEGYCFIDFEYIDAVTNVPTNKEDCLAAQYVCDDAGGSYWYPIGTPESCEADYGVGALEIEAEWVEDPIIWRIVRINEDGSVRLVTEENMGNTTFNDTKNDNAYVGYMYGTTGSSTYALTHTNTTNSKIKESLDTWYTKYLSNYSNLFATDAGFCNDRSVSTSSNTWMSDDTALGFGTNKTYYAAFNRLININKPRFGCPQTDDLFTTKTSSKGNKTLDNPIGTITADEVVYAGGKFATNNDSYYLDNNNYWHTMTPFAFEDNASKISYIDSTAGYYYGFVYYGDADNAVGYRPVVNLKESVQVISGDGTINNPYVINTN